MTTYLVNEIYPCLQGEGNYLGTPSLLVRFQICNLRCTWCDTPYTHTYKSDPIYPNTALTDQNFKRYELIELVSLIHSQPLKHLILTGGEPTLQNLAPLAHALGSEYEFEVETNGTRIPHKSFKSFLEDDYALFQWNVSPKFSNAGEEIEQESLQFWSQLALKQKNVFFKFVIRKEHAEEDLVEILSLQQKFNLKAERIFLMPEGTDVDSQITNVWLHDLCLEHSFRYSPRLHVLLFGSRRGV